MKTKITLLTIVATVALAGAAFSAKAQFISVRAYVPVPRICIPVPRVIVPAPRVWCAPAPAPVCEQAPVCAPAPVCEGAVYGAPACGGAVYEAPVYRERIVERCAPVYVRRGYYGCRRW